MVQFTLPVVSLCKLAAAAAVGLRAYVDARRNGSDHSTGLLWAAGIVLLLLGLASALT